jgi:hypothetical protein
MDTAREVKDVEATSAMAQQQQQMDVESTMKDLIMMIQQQQEEQRKDREILVELLKKQQLQDDPSKKPSRLSAESVRRRTTIYLPRTPQRVNDRTSMGGAVHLENSSASGSVDEWDEDHGNSPAEEHDDDEENISLVNGKNIKKTVSVMKVKEPPVFQSEATSDVNRWLELIEDFMSCFNEDEVMKVQKAMMYLGEGPRIFVKTAEQEAKKEGRPFLWKDVKQTLLECFLPTITEDIARMRLSTLRQTGSMWEYTAEFRS